MTATDLLARYKALPEVAIDSLSDKDRDSITDMGSRLDQYGSFLSDKAERFFGVLVRKAERAAQDAPGAQRTLATIPPLAERAGPEVAKVAAERDALAAEVVRLQAELLTARQRADDLDEERKEALGERDALQRANEALQGEVNALRAEVKSAAPSPRVSPLAIERAAKFGASQVEKALLIALRQQLAGEDAAKIKALPGPILSPVAVTGEPIQRRAVLDLDDAPGVTGELLAPTPKPDKVCQVCGKVVASVVAVTVVDDYRYNVVTGTFSACPDCKVLHDVGPAAEKAFMKASKDVKDAPAKASAGPASAPVTPARAPEAPGKVETPDKGASKLQKCPACKRYALGAHKCS